MSNLAGAQNAATRFKFLWKRITGSAVFWSWGLNGIRLGFGVLVLPLLVLLLPTKEDLGFYQLMTQLVVVVPLLDIGLSFAIERSLNYAMGGATELKPQGVHLATAGEGRPNATLLWQIIQAAKLYYSFLAAAGFVGLGLVGSWLVARSAGQTSNPTACWVTLGIAVANAGFEVYAGWWGAVLRGVNGIQASARIGFFAHGLKLALSCVLLLAGMGVPSVFAAGFVSSVVLRFLSRRAALALLPPPAGRSSRAEIWGLLRVLWPTSWRVGLQVLGSFLTNLLMSVLCFEMFNLGGYQEYGLTLQVANLIQGIASVWVSVKWPMVGQLRARHDHAALQRLLWPRFWLQAVTFVSIAMVAAVAGPYLLRLISTTKQLLPEPWLMLVFIQGFLDLQVSFWTFLLATENRVPSLWPMLASYVVTLVLVLILTQTTSLGIGAFAVAPLLSNIIFNYWYWPITGARNLRTSFWRFAFARRLTASN